MKAIVTQTERRKRMGGSRLTAWEAKKTVDGVRFDVFEEGHFGESGYVKEIRVHEVSQECKGIPANIVYGILDREFDNIPISDVKIKTSEFGLLTMRYCG